MHRILIFDDDPANNGWAYSRLVQTRVGEPISCQHVTDIWKNLEGSPVTLLITETTRDPERARKLLERVREKFPNLRIIVIQPTKFDKFINIEEGPITYMTRSSSWKFEWTVRLLLKVSTPTRPVPLPPISTRPILYTSAGAVAAKTTIRPLDPSKEPAQAPHGLVVPVAVSLGSTPVGIPRAPQPLKPQPPAASMKTQPPRPLPVINLESAYRKFKPAPLGQPAGGALAQESAPSSKADSSGSAAGPGAGPIQSDSESQAQTSGKPGAVTIPTIEEKKIPPSVLNGDLRNVLLGDVLQMICLGKQSGCLVLLRQNYQGELYIDRGELVHAKLGDLQGENLAYALLGWGTGQFYFDSSKKPEQRTIYKHWDHLLLEASRLNDESKT